MHLENLRESLVARNIVGGTDPDTETSSDAAILVVNSSSNLFSANQIAGGGTIGVEEKGTTSDNVYSDTVVGPNLPSRTFKNCTGSQVEPLGRTYVDAPSADVDFRVGEYARFVLNPSAAIHLRPTGLSGESFTAGYTVTVVNLSAIASITFDPVGVNDKIAAGKSAIYSYTGSGWHKIYREQ